MLLLADADLVRRDRALPALATLLDPDAFTATLRRCLPELNLRAVESTYVKYSPGNFCLVGYRIDIAGASVDVYAKAYRPDAEKKLRLGRDQSSVPGALGIAHLVLEDDALVISVFPNDSELRALPRLTGAGACRDLLRELLPGQADLWNGTVQSLRYKPERRFVARVLTRAGPQAVLKFHAEPDYPAAQGNANAFRSRGVLRVACRLGCLDRDRIVAVEWLPGRLLSEASHDPNFDCRTVATVAAALAELHAQDPEGLKNLAREEEVAALFKAASGIEFFCPPLAGRAWHVAQRLASRFAQEPPLSRPIHGDFHEKQVLLHGDTVAFLDFDKAVCGDPAADLGNFMAHLERRCLGGKRACEQVAPVRAALYEGYRGATRRPLPDRIQLYEAAELLRRGPRMFRRRKPNWPEVIEALVTRAEALLSAGREKKAHAHAS